MAGHEVERKWLVEAAPADVLAIDAEPIEQGYLALEADGGEVRLRRRAGGCYLTAKSGSGLVRRELETELAPEQFEALWPATEGRRLEKTRRVIELPGQEGRLSVELDEYAGRLVGLRVAEVEFPDEESARAFSPLAWFADEVTERDEFRNRSLAAQGRPSVTQ